LPEALESMSEFALSLQELRRKIGLAFIYPCIVILIAFAFFVAFVALMVPRIGEFYRLFRLPTHGWLILLGELHATVHLWAPACLIVALLGLFWRGGSWTGSRAPWMWSILANFHRSTFARLLGLLIDHHVPLPQALRLAGEAAGDRSLATAATKLANDVAAGQSLSEGLKTQARFPPFMRWMISSGEQQGALSPALHQVAEVYRRRALFRADWYRVALPVALTVLLGGGAVLLYGLTLFLPLTDMLRDLTLEPI
jgi:general secretion pathway protein F